MIKGGRTTAEHPRVLTEPYSSEAAAGAQPNMPAMAQGPLEEPPGPVSPGW